MCPLLLDDLKYKTIVQLSNINDLLPPRLSNAFAFAVCLNIRTVRRKNEDFNTRRLEYRTIQWHGKDKSLGCIVFRCTDDVRQLCTLQFTCCYFGRRLQLRGKSISLLNYSFDGDLASVSHDIEQSCIFRGLKRCH